MTRRFPSLVFVMLCTSAVLLSEQAAAQRVIHRVRFGDTFPRIAQSYYGTAELAQLLAQANRRSLATSLQPGERIRVPTAWTYKVPQTTSVADLATHLLGAKHRRVALRAFNTIRGERVRAGTTLLIPFSVTHVARQGDTFAALAKHYYHNFGRARLIAEYNAVRSSAPAVGQELEIPIARVRITRDRMLELINERLLGIGPAHDDVRDALQEANASLRRGDYWEVPLRLIRMLAARQTSDISAAEVFKLLAIAYVALDKHDLAARAFREALLHQPTLKLDAVRDSPKVIRAFIDAQARRGDQR